MNHKKAIGFTLIEILVSMVIVGIILSFVVVSYGDFGETRRLVMTQQHFADLIQLAQNRAIITNQTYGINISNTDYRFFKFEMDNANGTWLPMSDPLFKTTKFNPHKKISYSHPLSKQTPEIIINSDGSITPFRLTITTNTDSAVSLSIEKDGRLILSESENKP